MDFQKVADSYYPMTSILSVEKAPDGKYGEIRVVAGNRKYIKVVEKPKYEDEIYRAGGDEFVVIVTGCAEEVFNKKVQALRSHMDMSNDVSLAIGCYYVSSGCDIRTAMRLADENMYKDKREYYKKHPKNDRRNEKRD